MRWAGWRAADDTWEPAATLLREVPLAVHCFLRQSAPRGNVKKSCRSRPGFHQAAPVRAEAQARARLPSRDAYRELFDLMRRQFPTTAPNDLGDIICESQCLVILQNKRGVVTAGACCSYDTDDAHGRLGYLHFLATDVMGQKHGTMLLHATACFLKQHGVLRLQLDSQPPDKLGPASPARGRRSNDPVAFYRSCGCQEQSRVPSTSYGASIPMDGNIDNVLSRCSHKLGIACLQLGIAQLQHVRLLPPIHAGPLTAGTKGEDAGGAVTPIVHAGYCKTALVGVQL